MDPNERKWPRCDCLHASTVAVLAMARDKSSAIDRSPPNPTSFCKPALAPTEVVMSGMATPTCTSKGNGGVAISGTDRLIASEKV